MVFETIFESIHTAGGVDEVCRVVISGGETVGKTSLAFALAYHEADRGGSPLFIGLKARLQTAPLVVRKYRENGGDGDERAHLPEVLTRIKMKYVTNARELKSLLLGLHAFSTPLTMVVIDDLSHIIDPVGELSRADPKFVDEYLLALALLDDLAQFSNAPRPVPLPADTPSTALFRTVVADDNAHLLPTRGLRKATDRMLRLERAPTGVWMILHSHVPMCRWVHSEPVVVRRVGELRMEEDHIILYRCQ